MINAEQRRIKGLGTISAALTPIQEKHDGYIPKSVISDAMKKLGLEEGAKEWLSTQGQYHIAKDNTRRLIQDDRSS